MIKSSRQLLTTICGVVGSNKLCTRSIRCEILQVWTQCHKFSCLRQVPSSHWCSKERSKDKQHDISSFKKQHFVGKIEMASRSSWRRWWGERWRNCSFEREPAGLIKTWPPENVEQNNIASHLASIPSPSNWATRAARRRAWCPRAAIQDTAWAAVAPAAGASLPISSIDSLAKFHLHPNKLHLSYRFFDQISSTS